MLNIILSFENSCGTLAKIFVCANKTATFAKAVIGLKLFPFTVFAKFLTMTRNSIFFWCQTTLLNIEMTLLNIEI